MKLRPKTLRVRGVKGNGEVKLTHCPTFEGFSTPIIVVSDNYAFLDPAKALKLAQILTEFAYRDLS